MKRILAFAILIAPYSAGAGEQLDPHGRADLKLLEIRTLEGRSECSVCHTGTPSGLLTRNTAAQTCSNCHAAVPHSGAAEHLGKTQDGEKIGCLSCHAPHRAGSKKADMPVGFPKALIRPLPEGHQTAPLARADGGMLKKTCVECHRWGR